MSKEYLTNKEGQKVVPFEEVTSQALFEFSENARARIVMDKDDTPQMFAFNTAGFLDLLSEIDKRFLEHASDKDYHSKEANPAGWLIDEIESHLPVSDEFADKIEKAVGKEDEWITEEELKDSLKK